jgi:ATP-dependent Clp protease ATP-binding subunit ClpX
MPVSVSLDLLDEEALVKILTEPKSAICKQYKKLFEIDGVELEFDEDALREIAKLAVERKTGARGLRSIVEKATMDMMFEIPSDDRVRKCTVTKEVITDGVLPAVEYSDEPRPRRSTLRKRIRRNDSIA